VTRQAAITALTLLWLAGCSGRQRSFDFAAQREPRPLPGNPEPLYPAELIRERLSGTVRMRFVVTDSGTVDTSTVEIAEASHPLFERAARDVLPRLRFLPAEVEGRAPECRTDVMGRRICGGGKRGRPVAQQTEMVFQFTPPPSAGSG
jgi:TonB family protein